MYYKVYTVNPNFTGKRRDYFFVKGLLIVDEKEVAEKFKKDGMTVEVILEEKDKINAKPKKEKGVQK
jgi:hypothetical protein